MEKAREKGIEGVREGERERESEREILGDPRRRFSGGTAWSLYCRYGPSIYQCRMQLSFCLRYPFVGG